MKLKRIFDALSKDDIERYKNLPNVSPYNFYFRLAAKFIPYIPKLKKQPNTTFPKIDVLGNTIKFSSSDGNNVKFVVNGVPVVVDKLQPSVSWLDKVISTLVQMEQDNKISINRPGTRTLVNDREDCRVQLNKYASVAPRTGESDEAFQKRMVKYQKQYEHDKALQKTFFTKFYKGVVSGKGTSALKKNASQQPYYSVDRFEVAKSLNPSFQEEKYSLFDNGQVSFYYRSDIPTVDLTDAQYTYEGESRPITEREGTEYSDSWARIPEASEFLKKYYQKGKGIVVYKDIATYMDDYKVKELAV